MRFSFTTVALCVLRLWQFTDLELVKSKLLVFYHFYFPDDVVSARHFEDFLQKLG